jgi:hypothetical protein
VLGSRVVRVMEERGHDVRALSRRTGTDLHHRRGPRRGGGGSRARIARAASDIRRLGASDPRQTRNLSGRSPFDSPLYVWVVAAKTCEICEETEKKAPRGLTWL